MSESYIIGNKPPADVVIEGDPYVSTRHARTWRDTEGRVWIEDLGSTNGTFVNERRVWQATGIGPGDVVRVGRTPLPWRP